MSFCYFTREFRSRLMQSERQFPSLQRRPVTFLELLSRSARTRIIAPDIRPIFLRAGSARNARNRRACHRLAEGGAPSAHVHRWLGTNGGSPLGRLGRGYVERGVGALFFSSRHILEPAQRVVSPGRRRNPAGPAILSPPLVAQEQRRPRPPLLEIDVCAPENLRGHV